MEMSLAGYIPYPTTLAVGSSALSIHLVAFSMVSLRWELYPTVARS
jgi:hypothetical protein